MNQTIRIIDVLTLVALLLGPVLAVLVSIWRENSGRKSDRRLAIFRTLMTTREANLAPDHVRALNSIDVEFYRYKGVRAAWKSYVDHLNTPFSEEASARWGDRRVQLFFELLGQVSKAVGYDFDDADIKRLTYRPKAHGDREALEDASTRDWADILAGRKPLRVVMEPTDLVGQGTTGEAHTEASRDQPIVRSLPR